MYILYGQFLSEYIKLVIKIDKNYLLTNFKHIYLSFNLIRKYSNGYEIWL